jgi:hypothetical protein
VPHPARAVVREFALGFSQPATGVHDLGTVPGASLTMSGQCVLVDRIWDFRQAREAQAAQLRERRRGRHRAAPL